MFEKLLKNLIYFWGLILAIVVLKTYGSTVSGLFDLNLDRLLTHFYAEASDTDVGTMQRATSLEHLTLAKNYGMTLHNIESCPIFYPGTVEEDRRCKKPNKYNTSSRCTNGVCTFTVEFGANHPERVGVCIKREDDCILEYFDVPEEPEVTGYTTTFKVTDALKEELGIHSWEDKINLEGAQGYRSEGTFIEGEVYTFFYDYKPESDALYVNDLFQTEVRFSEEK
jgi:hypothetical protein